MHYWNGWGTAWPAGALMIILMVLLSSALITAVVIMLRRTPKQLSDSAPRILDERFARGEIDEQEYRQRKAALRENV